MKLQVGVIAALALAAGPAAAQGYGTFAPGQSPPAGSYKPKPLSSAYGSPPASAPASRPKTYAPPPAAPPAFKPYRGSSTYSGGGSTTSLFGPDGKKKR